MSVESYIANNSFKFGTVDMWDTWQLRILKVDDVLKPRLRERKKQIPQRHGKYDYGAKYYDERTLTLRCVRLTDISRSDQHQLAYTLYGKDEIRLYDDPDKYYVGRIYKEPVLTQVRNGGLQITLEFTCEPFRYGLTKTESFTSADGALSFTPNYHGTAPTPTYIVITNTGSANATNIQIVQTNQKEK